MKTITAFCFVLLAFVFLLRWHLTTRARMDTLRMDAKETNAPEEMKHSKPSVAQYAPLSAMAGNDHGQREFLENNAEMMVIKATGPLEPRAPELPSAIDLTTTSKETKNERLLRTSRLCLSNLLEIGDVARRLSELSDGSLPMDFRAYSNLLSSPSVLSCPALETSRTDWESFDFSTATYTIAATQLLRGGASRPYISCPAHRPRALWNTPLTVIARSFP